MCVANEIVSNVIWCGVLRDVGSHQSPTQNSSGWRLAPKKGDEIGQRGKTQKTFSDCPNPSILPESGSATKAS